MCAAGYAKLRQRWKTKSPRNDRADVVCTSGQSDTGAAELASNHHTVLLVMSNNASSVDSANPKGVDVPGETVSASKSAADLRSAIP